MEFAARALAFASALFPIGLLSLFFYARAGGRVTAELIGVALMFGALSVLLVLGFGLGLELLGLTVADIANPYLRGLVRAFFLAAIPEEAAKLCVLLFIVLRHEDCDRPADILIGAIAVALGFAAFENLFYLYEALEKGRLSIVGPARAVLPVPMHAMSGIFMGLFVAGILHAGSRRRQYAAGLGVAVALHGIYDAPLMIIGYLEKPVGLSDLIVPGILLLFFLIVVAVAGVLSLRHLRAVDWDAPVLGQEEPSRWRRLFLSAWFWRMVGLLLLLWGLSAAGFGAWGISRKDAAASLFLMQGIIPVIFGLAMLRLIPRRPPAAV